MRWVEILISASSLRRHGGDVLRVGSTAIEFQALTPTLWFDT
jgi:hypothetical protein